MILRLTRDAYLEAGIFGQVKSEDGTLVLQTLETAYAHAPDRISYGTAWGPGLACDTYRVIPGSYVRLSLRSGETSSPFYSVLNRDDKEVAIITGKYLDGYEVEQILVGINRVKDLIVSNPDGALGLLREFLAFKKDVKLIIS